MLRLSKWISKSAIQLFAERGVSHVIHSYYLLYNSLMHICEKYFSKILFTTFRVSYFTQYLICEKTSTAYYLTYYLRKRNTLGRTKFCFARSIKQSDCYRNLTICMNIAHMAMIILFLHQ